jgi:hypothetical protein
MDRRKNAPSCPAANMPRQRKKTKKQLTLNLEGPLLRAIELQAAREKTDRVKWLTTAAEDKLRALGKWPP